MFNKAVRIVVFTTLFFVTDGFSSTGYYLALKNNVKSNNITPDFLSNYDFINKKYNFKSYNVSLASGYMYKLPGKLGIGGEVYIGYSFKNNDINETISDDFTIRGSKIDYNKSSDLEIKNKFSTGFDALIGANFFGMFGFFKYGINFQFPYLKGSLISDTDDIKNKEIMYFGKESKNIGGVSFSEVKSSFNFVPSFTFGIGVRKYFVDKFFVGLEFKHVASKTKDLKLRYAYYNPNGVFDNVISDLPIIQKDKLKVPFKFNDNIFEISIGIRL